MLEKRAKMTMEDMVGWIRILRCDFIRPLLVLIFLMGGCVRKSRHTLQEKEGETIDRINTAQGTKIALEPRSKKFEGDPSERYRMKSITSSVDSHSVFKKKNPNLETGSRQASMSQQIMDFINNQPCCLPDQLISQDKSGVIKTQCSINPMEVDYEKPYGIKNLPPQWEEQLGNSSILHTEVIQNPQAMIEIISTFDQIFCESIISKKILTTKQFQRIVQKVEFILQNPAIEYNFHQTIGEGGVCKVFRATQRQNSKQEYAVRIIKVNDTATLRKLKSQIAVMHICENSNSIEYHFSHYFKETLFMFTEYMDFGTLTQFIKHHKQPSEQIIAYILKQILLGLTSIHKKSQIHRDLKSDNILINVKGQVKIGDFGHALQLTKQKLDPQQIVGTPAWMAPQLIKKESYNESADIWSLGIVAIEIFKGQPPYLRINKLKAMYNIVSQPAPTIEGNCSDQFKNFVSSCLQKEPESRPSANNLLKHPLISKSRDDFALRLKMADLISKCRQKN